MRSSKSCVLGALLLSAGLPLSLLAEPVLTQWNDTLTTYTASATGVQKIKPLVQQRGTDLEGGARFGGAPGPMLPAPSSGYASASLGGIDLATLTWGQADVDIALPTDGPSVVIGRTFNHRQGNGSSVTVSNGPQGSNWFQSAMPELAFVAGASDDKDMVYLVLGAGRFLEYKRTAHASNEFKGVNGASGVVHYVSGTKEKYTLTDGAGTVWTFWGATKTASAWQFWKKTDAAGRTAYVGDKTSELTALADYNADGTAKEIFQEYGTGSDERRYTFTYGVTIGSVNRLTEVKVETKTGGTWASPTGLTEIGRVSYDYYTASTANATDSTDFYGNAGDLKTVKIRTPLSDSGSTLSSGVYDERTKYYRYYDTYNAGAGRHGHPHAIKLIVGFEGCRRFDWTDSTFDDDFADASVAGSLTSNLKSYSDAYFEYESSSSTQRIETAFFNGECGCSGGSNGTYTFTPSSNGSYTNNTGYDTAWCTRTVVAQPDGSYQTRYFDEVAQPLNAVVSNINPTTGGALYWVTGIDRDSSGRVTTVHSPSNLSSYTHSTGAASYSTSAGLVTFVDRYTTGEPSYDSSGELDGLVSGTGFKTGTSGTKAYTIKNVLGKRSITVGSSTVARPLVTESRAFNVANSVYTNAGDYDATTYTYDWWDTTTNTNQLYIALKSVTTTLPAVATANNGQNSTHNAVSYLRKDGRTAISVAPDGIYTAAKYNNLGLPTRTVQDADPSVSGDFDTNYGPGNFGLSTSSNSGLTYATEADYDSVGRTVTSTVRPGSSFPVKRVAYMYYSQLADHRLTTVSTPRYDNSGTPTWYGPMSYNVTNQGGKGEFSCTLGPSSGVTTSLTSWIDETQSDPLDALHSTLSGTSRAYVKNVSTTILDTPGVRPTETRKYTLIITSGAWTGSSGTNYDKTEYAYDDMGRVVRAKDPTGTIDRTVYDAIGRRCATWTGTIDTNGWTASGGNGTGDDLTQTSAVAYDGATVNSTLAVGDGLVTSSVTYVQGNATTGIGDSGTQRATTMAYDVRGNLIATTSPQAPHAVTNYDVRRRPTSSAIYSSASGFSGSSATSTTTNRVGLTETFYDERGRVYKTTRHMIYQSGGSAGTSGDSLDSLTWYDSAGRAIKTGGTSLTKTFYDRLGRPTNQFALARTDDSAYADADDVSGDIVLEESQTVYDDADKTGLVAMTATIIRNYDDTSTTGALDTNADGNKYKLTMANLAGRVQINATWYDEWDRATDSVVYGTNGGSDFDRRPSGSWLSLPSRGGTPLRTTTAFDAWGRVYSVEQPRVRTGTTGYINSYRYDDASRKITEVRNDTGGLTTSPLRDNDLYTRYEYTNGLMTKMWVDVDADGFVDSNWNTSSPYNALDNHDQVTSYYFDPAYVTGTLSLSPPAGKITTKRLLIAAVYPEQASGQSVNDRAELFAYNAQGQTLAMRDQNGTLMDKAYDTAGRLTIDTATTLGSAAVDGAVRRIETAYDSRGMVSTVTQYNATSSGSVVDQVQNTYDDWGNLKIFQQDYNGAVAGSGGDDLGVEYTNTKVNDTSAVSGKRRSGIRVTGVKLERSAGATTVQDVRHTFSSSSSYDDDIGRVTTVTDSGGSTTYAEYLYGGVGVAVQTKLSQPSITYELATSGTSGYNTFLDQFGRVIKSRWRNTSTGAIWYDSNPAYDDNSNITKVDNAWVTPFGALYTSDAINRLTGETVGKIVSNAIANADTVRTEDWALGATKLSQTGNWTSYKAYRGNPSVSTNLEYDQRRTNTGRNEVVEVIDGASSTQQPKYQVDQKGSSLDDETGGSYGYKYTYDAWNRLVKTTNKAGSTVITEYRYNGLGHRIGWKAQFDTGLSYANNLWRYFQYNERWQQVAMYVESSAGANTVGSNAIETYVYDSAGLDGRGGSSYIDRTIFRDRDANGGATGDGTREERRYYLQNWRNDVVVLVKSTGEIVERYRYDAYGRPESYSPIDVTGNNGGPDGIVNGSDLSVFYAAWSANTLSWITDQASSGGSPVPDNAVSSADYSVYYSKWGSGATVGGVGLISASTIDNRKGLAGYEFDPILAGNGDPKGSSVPVYHVRNRALNSYAGKWLQKDPLGYHDGMDLYEYCKSDPEGKVDAMGLASSDGNGSSCCAKSTYATSELTDMNTVTASNTYEKGEAYAINDKYTSLNATGVLAGPVWPTWHPLPPPPPPGTAPTPGVLPTCYKLIARSLSKWNCVTWVPAGGPSRQTILNLTMGIVCCCTQTSVYACPTAALGLRTVTKREVCCYAGPCNSPVEQPSVPWDRLPGGGYSPTTTVKCNTTWYY